MTKIRFTYDKTGRKRADYWSKRAMRWLPMGVQKAKDAIKAGSAELSAGHVCGLCGATGGQCPEGKSTAPCLSTAAVA